ncbi:haloacid dehalogenase-like hydrolase [Aspergillus terreus]|uniref:Haloacid dehalogenase-like hydrolase n=1 Tax=Aspergillus terreus TaxID=33178 RepID=A0A5M3Z5F5_ASPTE|nr:hypothetical protein ATETN484_0009011300 [Aspergillus terreus]GFF17564.1 haloacid dehalogenase-like hydrolase [Aspergillus terreus]
MPPRSLLLTIDAFGTLFHPRHPVPEQYASAAYAFGIPRTALTPANLQTAFKTEFKAQSQTHPNYGREEVLRGQYGGPRQWWEELIRASFARAMTPTPAPSEPLPDGLVQHLLDRFASKEGYALYDDVEGFFARMRAVKARAQRLGPFSRVVVGVISNSDDRVPAVLESLGLRVGSVRADEGVLSRRLPGFETRGEVDRRDCGDANSAHDIDLVVTSYEAGEEKPSPRIFEVARRQAARAARQAADNADSWTCVHVGDDYEKDYRAAINAGWIGYYLPRGGEGRCPDGSRTIRSLMDLFPDIETYE